jgi:hypothetical protein
MIGRGILDRSSLCATKLWQPFAPLAYMLARMSAARLLAAMGLAAAAAACAPTMGPPPPRSMTGPVTFDARQFAWSQAGGANTIAGRLGYRQGATAFSCAGSSVVLTPETPWSRQRMAVLYGSTERAVLPSDEVRARTANAPAGDAGPYVKRATCDDAGRFTFTGLPDGAWYAITVARPVGQPDAGSTAVMRRVVTRGGRTVSLVL